MVLHGKKVHQKTTSEIPTKDQSNQLVTFCVCVFCVFCVFFVERELVRERVRERVWELEREKG